MNEPEPHYAFKEFWKNRYDELYSYWLDEKSKYCLKYELNKKTEAKIGGIFCFRKINQDIFLRIERNVFLVRGEDVVKLPNTIIATHDDDDYIEKYWAKNIRNNYDNRTFEDQNIILFKSITPILKINNKEEYFRVCEEYGIAAK